MTEKKRKPPDSLRTNDVAYGQDYWDSLDSGEGYQRSTMWEDLAHAVKEVLGIEGGRDIAGSRAVIDVGCAMGYMVEQLRRRGFDAWGVDVSEYALKMAPPEVSDYLRWYDMTWTSDTFFGRDRFNIVLCFETMEHIPNGWQLQNALDNLYNLLRVNGIMVLTICTSEQPGWDTDPTHVNIQPRAWWTGRFDAFSGATPHLIRREDLEDRFRQFWLFSEHHGVFVLQRTA